MYHVRQSGWRRAHRRHGGRHVRGAYVFPTVLAAVRKKTTLGKIALVNILLGWTVAGWGVALYWALNGEGIRGKAGPTP